MINGEFCNRESKIRGIRFIKVWLSCTSRLICDSKLLRNAIRKTPNNWSLRLITGFLRQCRGALKIWILKNQLVKVVNFSIGIAAIPYRHMLHLLNTRIIQIYELLYHIPGILFSSFSKGVVHFLKHSEPRKRKFSPRNLLVN